MAKNVLENKDEAFAPSCLILATCTPMRSIYMYSRPIRYVCRVKLRRFTEYCPTVAYELHERLVQAVARGVRWVRIAQGDPLLDGDTLKG